jgi:hypothetical protein
MSRRVYYERQHLNVALPAILAKHPTAQLWLITAAAADGANVNAYARSVVAGTRRLLKQPRLKARMITSFSVLEVSQMVGREPCAHTHTLLVTKPITVGRNRISEADWIGMWEAACPLARKRDPSVRLIRKGKKKPNLSIVAEHVPRHGLHVAHIIEYVTKWANVSNVNRNYQSLLTDPPQFIERIQSLIRVTRFFGTLHLPHYSRRVTPS